MSSQGNISLHLVRHEPDETFHQFLLAKLKMLSRAFPESLPATHISRIRSKFGDSKANRFIREKHDLMMFGEECREYDEHDGDRGRR